jgi:hypothetical protein
MGAMMNEDELANFNLIDVAIFHHGYTPYMRDYYIEYEVGGPTTHAGLYRCLFTRCVVANVVTRVRSDSWRVSWDDVFIDFKTWEDAGAPDGFVWGANWSLAYPGLEHVPHSPLAALWSAELKKEMHEVTIETEAYHIQLIFHDIKMQKLGSDVKVIDKVILPLGKTSPPDPAGKGEG